MRQLERALAAERLRESSDAAGRTELLLALGEALTRAGHAPARTVFGTAAALARGRAPEQLARAAIGYGGRYYEAGVIDPKLSELGAQRCRSPTSQRATSRARLELERLLDGLDAIPRDFFRLATMTLLAEASAVLRSAAAAARLYGELAPFESRWVQVGYAASDGPVARSLGLLAAACGDLPRAAAHFEQALGLCTAAGAAAFEARARADLRLRRGTGERDESAM